MFFNNRKEKIARIRSFLYDEIKNQPQSYVFENKFDKSKNTMVVRGIIDIQSLAKKIAKAKL